MIRSFSILACGLVALLGSPSVLPAQGLAFSLRSEASTGDGAARQFARNDTAYFSPTDSSSVGHWFGRRSLALCLGDLDGNSHFDDAPTQIDALMPASTFGDMAGVWFSFSTNVTTLDGTTIEDGDIVALSGQGQVSVIFPESLFSSATGTSGVDVDSFHMAPDGTAYFSFAQDETTSNAGLIAQNGGDAVLDESTLLAILPGGVAQIAMTRDQVVATASAAVGASLSTVVDLTGVCGDPEHPGELWLTFGSANDAIEGRVVSTFNGGTLAAVGGTPVDSVTFGFEQLEILEGLAWLDLASPPLALFHPADTVSSAGVAIFEVSGAQPFSTVQLVMAPGVRPAEPVTHFSEFLQRGFVHLQWEHPLAASTLQSPGFGLVTDDEGYGGIAFSLAGVPPGLELTCQAYDMGDLDLAPAIGVVVSP